MVTRLSDPERLLSQLKDDKWDLEDLSKRDSWLIIIKAKLKKDPNVWAAVKYGPPTVEALMAADSKLTRTSALAALPALQTQYEDSNKDGYNILVDRISFAKKPALAQKVERDYSDTSDGHSVWKIVEDALDESSSESQASLQIDYANFLLCNPNEVPVQCTT